MTNSLQLGGVYILMAVMLVLGMLMSRRGRSGQTLTMLLAWVAIFGAGFVLFTFRDDFGWVAQRLRAEATGGAVQRGQEIRIPMAIDGHFWVEAELNGKDVRFLVDSGATMTTIGRQTAERIGVEVSPKATQVVRTGNGFVQMWNGRVDHLRIESLERRNLAIHVAASDSLNVLGMNFLSSLERWGVEGRWLVLVP